MTNTCNSRHSHGIQIMCTETGATFNSAAEAACAYGITGAAIRRALDDPHATASDRHWRTLPSSRNRNLRQPIVCIETGVLYESITAASSCTGTSQPSISRAIHSPIPFKLAAGGSHWATLDCIDAMGGIDVAKELVAQKHVTRRMLRANPGNGIRCVETGRRYASISEASRKLRTPWARIKNAIDNNTPLKGYHWEAI